ncbi:hypothetical protein SAMN02745866_02988 [Alteromonadaceae bacterium Bs31]|nr:hypothetical protein SAMN02745866_02988 [Alteromonadaceae bacterium Bs31]
MKYKKFILGVIAFILLLFFGFLLMQPLLIKAVKAKFKSTDHFLVLQEDTRIFYEETAKKNALILAGILPSSKSSVERILKNTFKRPIEVYICSTQEVFNEYVFLSKNVRGAVYWEKVFLSPGAFSRGSLDDLVQHELTHYLFYSHIGEKAHIKSVPLWFREGIAVFVANGGESYTKHAEVYGVMSNQERKAYLSGETDFWFKTTNIQDAVTSSGVANWLLYRVGGLFVHFMHASGPDKFDALVQRLLIGESFDTAVQLSYNRGIENLHAEFSEYLQTHTQKIR